MLHGRTRTRNWISSTFIASALMGALTIAGAAPASATRLGPPGTDASPTAERMYQIQVRLARFERLLREHHADAMRRTHRADRVIAAAASQIGVPYVYASARPGRGFDCSGLVMWAYGRVGIHLPHNSTAIYLALPHVSRADLQPGDILYFREPEDHVAIYLGHGLMIHAPGWGQHVRIAPVYWRYFYGAARPA
jgi:cell wall-associated NlpC family hydrolase